MILDHIDRIDAYSHISKHFAEAVNFLQAHKNGDLPVGRYEISDSVYAMVQHYETKDPEVCAYEAHKRYIDIQYMLKGNECMGWQYLPKMHEDGFDEQKDYLKISGEGQPITVEEGTFVIFFPSDAHQPGMKNGSKAAVEKIVVKVPAA